MILIVTNNKVFVKCKILSTETVLSAYTRARTHTHTHTGTPAHTSILRRIRWIPLWHVCKAESAIRKALQQHTTYSSHALHVSLCPSFSLHETHARVRTHHNPPNLSPQTSSSLCQESGSSSQSFRSCPNCRSCCDRWTRVCWGGSWWCSVSASWPETGRVTSSRDGQRDCLPWHHQTPDHLKMCQPELKWSTGWL